MSEPKQLIKGTAQLKPCQIFDETDKTLPRISVRLKILPIYSSLLKTKPDIILKIPLVLDHQYVIRQSEVPLDSVLRLW